MKVLRWLIFIVTVIGIATAAHADTGFFSETFDSENNGVGSAGNYTGFANWVVTSGSVDLTGYGSWAFIPNYGGVYVDLDGSNYAAGTLRSTEAVRSRTGNGAAAIRSGRFAERRR